MANNCLVTKLKSIVNNDNLLMFNKIRIKFEASDLKYNPYFTCYNLPEGKTIKNWISENVSVKNLNGQDIPFTIANDRWLEFTSPNSGGIIYIDDKAHFGDFVPNIYKKSGIYTGYKFVSDKEYSFLNCFPIELWSLYNNIPVTLSPASNKIIATDYNFISLQYNIIANVVGGELLDSVLTLADNAPRIKSVRFVNKVTPLSWFSNFPNINTIHQELDLKDMLSGNIIDLAHCLNLGNGNDMNAFFKPSSSLVTGNIADLCDALKANGKKNSAFQYVLSNSPNIVNIPGAILYQDDRYHVDFDENGNWTVYTGS